MVSRFIKSTFDILIGSTVRNHFPVYDQKTQFLKFFASSAASKFLTGTLSILLLYPLDVAFIRRCADVGRSEFTSPFHCLASIVAQGGFMALYAGVGTSLFSTQLFSFFYFVGCSYIRDSVSHLSRDWSEGLQHRVRHAAMKVNGIAADIACQPFRVVRYRLILQAGHAVPLYRGAFHCLAAVVWREGVGALFAGAGVRAGEALLIALLMVGYDMIRCPASTVQANHPVVVDMGSGGGVEGGGGGGDGTVGPL